MTQQKTPTPIILSLHLTVLMGVVGRRWSLAVGHGQPGPTS